MIYIIFDLEATCWPDKKHTSEIIEIGAVKINEEGKIIDEFCAFIKPILHPKLSDFCKKLTTIKQEEVDNAALFPEVIASFQKWINISQNNYFLCSWGYYDKKQLTQDAKLHKQRVSWLKKHISVKHQYQNIVGLKRPIGLGNAIDLEGFTFEGTAHRGIDDAKNIAKIFIKYLDQWKF